MNRLFFQPHQAGLSKVDAAVHTLRYIVHCIICKKKHSLYIHVLNAYINLHCINALQYPKSVDISYELVVED